MTPAPERITVRATVHLEHLRVGEIVDVDPDDPYIAGCLAGELLVPVEESETRASP